MYSREVIEEMNMLSKEVFGSKSRWRKLVEKGVLEQVLEDTKKVTFEGKEQKVTYIKTQKSHVGKNGDEIMLSTTKRYSVEEAKAKMLEIKEQFAQLKLQYEAAQAEKTAKEAEEKAKQSVALGSGSARV